MTIPSSGLPVLLLALVLAPLAPARARAGDPESADTVDAACPAFDDAALPEAMRRPLEVLDVRRVDLGDVLRAVAVEYELNLHVDASVDMPVTVRLAGLPVYEALRFLCRTHGLEIGRSGAVFRIRRRIDPPEPPPPPDVTVRGGRLSARLEEVDLGALVRALQEQSGRSFVVRRGVGGAVSGYLHEAELEAGLEALLSANGFRLERRGEVYLVEREGPAPGGEDGASRRLRVERRDSLLDLDAADAPLLDALRLLEARLEAGLVLRDVPPGQRVTARLRGATVEEALRALLVGTGLSYRRHDDAWLVGPSGLPALVETRLLRLRHVRAEGLPDLLPNALLGDVDVRVVPVYNALSLAGPRDAVDALAGVVRDLDRPTPQVLIEALVVDVRASALRRLGLTLGAGSDSTAPAAGFGFGHGAEQLGGLAVEGGAGMAGRALNLFGRLLGARPIGPLPADFYVRVQALEQDGRLAVRSRPQIATLNGQEAHISIGTTQYYLLTTVTPFQSPNQIVTQQSQTFTEIEANVSLKITPWVGASGSVTVDILPEFQTPVGSFDADTPPTINSRVLRSTVRLRDGETIILGGLIQEAETVDRTRVPVLGSIPLLGRLFRNRKTSKTRSELVIFVTLHVFHEDAAEPDRWRLRREALGLSGDSGRP